MPIYEYLCNKCAVVSEQIFPIRSFPQTIECPSCNGEAHKIISRNSFVLEGGGWGKDGYTTNMEKFKSNMKAVDSY